MSKFTTDRTYPREWYRAGRWSVVPRAKIFERETEHMLFWKNSRGTEFRENKKGWYPTLEKAEAVVAAFKAHDEAYTADKRVRDAAPDLLAALKEFQAHVIRHSCTWDDAQNGSHHHPVWQKVADAIAKAEGGAA